MQFLPAFLLWSASSCDVSLSHSGSMVGDFPRRLHPHAGRTGRQDADALVARQLALAKDVGVEDPFIGGLFVHRGLSRP